MENIEQKAEFLQHRYISVLNSLDADTSPLWGKMNVQQMIEHMSGGMRLANGKTITAKVITPEDRLPLMLAFLETEKPFKENTPNPMLPDTPYSVKHATKELAIAELQQEIDDFFYVYEKEPGRKGVHASFGELDYEHQVQLLHKHATHHLRQFGVMEH